MELGSEGPGLDFNGLALDEPDGLNWMSLISGMERTGRLEPEEPDIWNELEGFFITSILLLLPSRFIFPSGRFGWLPMPMVWLFDRTL
jgi:hypothetical protein